MAFYRFNPSGLTLEQSHARVEVVISHLRTWGVTPTAFKVTATVGWVQTQTDIATLLINNILAHLGFTLTRSTAEPTTF